jgi:hypothetical protein
MQLIAATKNFIAIPEFMSARQAALTAHAKSCNNVSMQITSTLTIFNHMSIASHYIRNTIFEMKVW